MTKLNFEIKVECKGSAAGTLGWLNEKLAATTLVIKNTKNGEAGMFAKEFTRVNEKGQKMFVNTFICKVDSFDPDNGWLYESRRISDTDLLSCKLYSDEASFGFVDIPLTKAAEAVLEEFLTKACEKFVEWWESDGEENSEKKELVVTL
ncbi:MAG: hypothetical protein ACOC22_01430 [bacterium]